MKKFFKDDISKDELDYEFMCFENEDYKLRWAERTIRNNYINKEYLVKARKYRKPLWNEKIVYKENNLYNNEKLKVYNDYVVKMQYLVSDTENINDEIGVKYLNIIKEEINDFCSTIFNSNINMLALNIPYLHNFCLARIKYIYSSLVIDFLEYNKLDINTYLPEIFKNFKMNNLKFSDVYQKLLDCIKMLKSNEKVRKL